MSGVLDEKQYGILFMGFNQDSTSFNIGTDNGFENYDTKTLTKNRMSFADSKWIGGIAIIESLFNSNYIFLVGGGANPKYDPKKVYIYEDSGGKIVGEMHFRTKVCGIRVTKDKIIVILEEKIYIYKWQNVNLIDQHVTAKNKNGICAVTYTSQFILACPALQPGNIRLEFYNHVLSPPSGKEVVIHYDDGYDNDSKRSLSGSKEKDDDTSSQKSVIINAHKSPIAALVFNNVGTLLATASAIGTVIRIYDVKTQKQTHELRRGKEPAQIHSIHFNCDSTMLLCSSNKGTIHIFTLGDFYKQSRTSPVGAVAKSTVLGSSSSSSIMSSDVSAPEMKNPTSLFSFAYSYIPFKSQLSNFVDVESYFKSEWSFCQYKLPFPIPHIVSFIETTGEHKEIIQIICADGTCFRVRIDMDQTNQTKLLNTNQLTFNI